MITVTKSDFERAVNVARYKDDSVFNSLSHVIDRYLATIAGDWLGSSGMKAVELDLNSALTHYYIDMACQSAFLSELRHLDLVITATGFGVVSTNDVAPASKQRVDAVETRIRTQREFSRCDLLAELFKLENWAEEMQPLNCVPTLFWHINMLERFASVSSPTYDNFVRYQSVITNTHSFLSLRIGHEYMQELIRQVATNSITAADRIVIIRIQRLIGLAISGVDIAIHQEYRDLINLLDGDTATYCIYANSKAYEINHPKVYENTQEKATFHFVG